MRIWQRRAANAIKHPEIPCRAIRHSLAPIVLFSALLFPAAVPAATPELTPVHSIGELFALGVAESRRAHPVDMQVIVTYADPAWEILFVRDNSGHMFIPFTEKSPAYRPGTRIRVTTVSTVRANSVAIDNAHITVLGVEAQGPVDAHSVEEIDKSDFGAAPVTTVGVLRPCDRDWFRACYRIQDGRKKAWVFLPQKEDADTRARFGSLVRVRGVVANRSDEPPGEFLVQIFVSSLKDIQVLDPVAPAAQAGLIRSLYPGLADQRFVRAVHLQGKVLWGEAGRFFLQDSTGTILVTLVDRNVYHSSQQIDVRGYPAHGEVGLELVDAVVSHGDPIVSGELPALQSAMALFNSRQSGQRVRVRGTLIEQHNESNQEVFQLEDGKLRFTALLPRVDAARELVGMTPGEELELTGVEVIRGGSPNWPANLLVLIESPGDIRVLAGRTWLTPLRALLLLSGLAFCILAPLVWVRQLRRIVRRQTRTIRTRMENEMQLESKYRRLFERNPAPVFTWREDGTILDCNQAFARLLGSAGREELRGHSLWEFVASPEIRNRLRAALQEEPRGNEDICLCRWDGTLVHLIMNMTPVRNAEGVVCETTAIDATQLRENEAELQRARDEALQLSRRDPLTGLPNRRQLSEKLATILTDARDNASQVALLYIDLDGFKLVNDSLGHSVGDQLLRLVAESLRDSVGSDCLLGRLGGDEFMAILDHGNAGQEAQRLAVEILSAVTGPFLIQNHSLTIGASIGVSCFPLNATSAEELMQQADQAMYAAKREGKNCVMRYSPAIGSDIQERLHLETQLRGAAERGEISVVYQPEFDALSGRIMRFEALARWNHPTLGAISPGRFIPIAEESGIISALGAWIMEQACREAAGWQAVAPNPIQVAVNVSGIQFRQQSFVEEVRAILDRTGLSADLLQLELTESAMLNNPSSSRTMHQLRALGISLAIDDFGTGYSNLSYLPSLPFDSLKIDGSFLSNIQDMEESQSMIRSVTSMAHDFGMNVIAEGVETPEQLELIRAIGVNELQGYLMGRPTDAPVMAFLQWVADQGGVDEAFSPDTPIPERAN